MESQLLQVIEFLVRQQFYKRDDIIMDRTKEQSIHVRNSGQAIAQFISILSAGLSDLLEGNYKKYLEMLKKHLKFDVKKVLEGFLVRISLLEPEERAPHLIVTFMLGEVLGDIRETAFKHYLQQIKKRLKNSRNSSSNFEDITGIAFEQNEPNIALIYNLCFLDFIAEAVNSQDLQEITKTLLDKYTTQFIENSVG